MFAADCVLAMTGEDPAVDFRKTYHTELGAARAIARSGGMAAGAAARLGESVAPAFASRGDVVLLSMGTREAYGICLGATVALPCEAGGVAFVPMTEALCAWRV